MGPAFVGPARGRRQRGPHLGAIHQPGTSACPPLCVLQYCVDVAADGTAAMVPAQDNEPLVLVTKSWQKSSKNFFVPVDQRPVDWQSGLIVTFSTIGGALLLWAAFLYGLHCRRTGRFTPRADAAAACRSLAACGSLSLWHGRAGRGSGITDGDSAKMGDAASSDGTDDEPGAAMQRALTMLTSCRLGERLAERMGDCTVWPELGGAVPAGIFAELASTPPPTPLLPTCLYRDC